MPTVSVIVPVYKVERYLARCIDSILMQTFPDFELILVDDGSPDRCGVICDDYAQKDKRIRVIHQQNARLSAARNAGIDIAVGKWIALIDSDDWVHRDYLKYLLFGTLEDTDVVICACLETEKEHETDVQYSDVSFRSASLNEIYADHFARSRAWGRLFRRDSIGDLRYISGTEPVEDVCFNELLYHREMRFRITEAKLYYYYIRPDSAVHTQMGRASLNAVGHLLERLKMIDSKEKRQRIISRCYKCVFSARYLEILKGNRAGVYKECRKWFRDLSAFLPELETKNRVMMRIISASPLAYRIWRLHDDHSLIQFEKEQRKLRRLRRKEAAACDRR